jgi:hypothetical protein
MLTVSTAPFEFVTILFPVTLLKFLLSSRICGSICYSLLKHNLSKFELRCEQEVDAASIRKRTAKCPLTISHVISRPI